MADAMALRVLTDAGLALDEQAVSVVAPGEPGYLGMLRNHAPLVTTLIPGTLTWRTPRGERRLLRVGAGLLEVRDNRITILTDLAEPIPAEGESRER
jgi:F-type H+-transporting ATPase subunit epsilon